MGLFRQSEHQVLLLFLVVVTVHCSAGGETKDDRLSQLRRQLSKQTRLQFTPSRTGRRIASGHGQDFSPTFNKKAMPDAARRAAAVSPSIQEYFPSTEVARDDAATALPRSTGTRSRVDAYLKALRQKFGVNHAAGRSVVPLRGQARSSRLDMTADVSEVTDEEDEDGLVREDRGILFFPGNVRHSFGIPPPSQPGSGVVLVNIPTAGVATRLNSGTLSTPIRSLLDTSGVLGPPPPPPPTPPQMTPSRPGPPPGFPQKRRIMSTPFASENRLTSGRRPTVGAGLRSNLLPPPPVTSLKPASRPTAKPASRLTSKPASKAAASQATETPRRPNSKLSAIFFPGRTSFQGRRRGSRPGSRPGRRPTLSTPPARSSTARRPPPIDSHQQKLPIRQAAGFRRPAPQSAPASLLGALPLPASAAGQAFNDRQSFSDFPSSSSFAPRPPVAISATDRRLTHQKTTTPLATGSQHIGSSDQIIFGRQSSQLPQPVTAISRTPVTTINSRKPSAALPAPARRVGSPLRRRTSLLQAFAVQSDRLFIPNKASDVGIAPVCHQERHCRSALTRCASDSDCGTGSGCCYSRCHGHAVCQRHTSLSEAVLGPDLARRAQFSRQGRALP